MTEEHRGGASAAEADRVGGNELVVTGDCTKMADGEGLGERCFLRDRIDIGLAGVFGGMRGPRELGKAGGREAGGIGGGVRTLRTVPFGVITVVVEELAAVERAVVGPGVKPRSKFCCSMMAAASSASPPKMVATQSGSNIIEVSAVELAAVEAVVPPHSAALARGAPISCIGDTSASHLFRTHQVLLASKRLRSTLSACS